MTEVSESRQDLVDANNALYGENQELKRQLKAAGEHQELLEQRILSLEMGNHANAVRLGSKITEARAPREAREERLKHQNNEMRVMMNRLHRHLSVGNLQASIAEWAACNDWLSKNNIEPYTGSVPGYPWEQGYD